MTSKNTQTQWGQFIPLAIVFFFWGFIAASNDILIPVFKKAFDLTQGQSQFVSIYQKDSSLLFLQIVYF